MSATDSATSPTPPLMRLDAMPCSVSSLRKAAIDRWYAKLKSDPKRWSERMETQRKRREAKEIRDRERQQEREAWAKLPKDHHRKTRKPQRTLAAKKAKVKRMAERAEARGLKKAWVELDDKRQILERKLAESMAYADKLADGLPVGMLPADVENLRHSNGVLADSLYKAERELASALSDVNLLKAHITELQSTKSILELQ